MKDVGIGPVSGEVLRWLRPISFLGDVDPSTGLLSSGGESASVKGKVLVFPEGAGSTVGSYVVYNLKLEDNAPVAMVMAKADAIITIGCILADIPLVHRFPAEELASISTGDRAEVDPSSGTVKVWSKGRSL